MFGLKSAILLLISVFTFTCNGCKPLDYNLSNPQSFVDDRETLLYLQKLGTPQFNETTVPNYASIVQKFEACKKNEDVCLNFTQLVTKYNYLVEEHEIETSDGYLLTIHRVRKNATGCTTSIPILLQHGVGCSSDDFIVAGPNKALAYLLADECYDVWLGNSRGNKYSRRHVSLSPDCGEFWEFSFNEMGRYDLPAVIDYILGTTNSIKLMYGGHSQGTTSFFIMCAERPEYNKKIAIMIALSAVVYMNDIRSPLIRLAALGADFYPFLYHAFGFYELAPSNEITKSITNLFCGCPTTAEIFCQTPIFLFSGIDYEQSDFCNLPVIHSHYPSGAATKQVVHYGQIGKSGRFANYDYGIIENIIRYGTAEPPEYSLENVTCPVALFYAMNDWLTSASATERFMKRVPNIVEFYHVPFPAFEHFDFLWAKNVKELVNKEVIYLAKKYAN